MQPRSSPHASLSLRFNVHWTRASSRPSRVPRTALPQGMYLRAGRPDIFATLQSVISGVRAAYSKSRGGSDLPSGVVIGSCGPAALMDDAARAVGRVSWADWKDVGGVESIEEYVCSPFLLYHYYRRPCAQRIWIFFEQGIWVVMTFFSSFFSGIAWSTLTNIWSFGQTK